MAQDPSFTSTDYTDISSMLYTEMGISISSSQVETDLVLPDSMDSSDEAERRRRFRKYIAMLLAVWRAIAN